MKIELSNIGNFPYFIINLYDLNENSVFNYLKMNGFIKESISLDFANTINRNDTLLNEIPNNTITDSCTKLNVNLLKKISNKSFNYLNTNNSPNLPFNNSNSFLNNNIYNFNINNQKNKDKDSNINNYNYNFNANSNPNPTRKIFDFNDLLHFM